MKHGLYMCKTSQMKHVQSMFHVHAVGWATSLLPMPHHDIFATTVHYITRCIQLPVYDFPSSHKSIFAFRRLNAIKLWNLRTQIVRLTPASVLMQTGMTGIMCKLTTILYALQAESSRTRRYRTTSSVSITEISDDTRT
jgi:hypothetical protein